MLPICKLRWLATEAPVVFAQAGRFVSMKEIYRRYQRVVDAVLPLWHPDMQRQGVRP